MVKIALDAAVKVESGPTIWLGTTLDSDSYSAAEITLGAKGAPDAADKFVLALVPANSTVEFLGVRVRETVDSKPANVIVNSTGPGNVPTSISISGSLVVASAAVLALIVDSAGPGELEFVNDETVPVTIDVLAAVGS